MNKQRKVVITVTYNDLGVIVDTKAEELGSSAQPNLQSTCNQLATDTISRRAAIDALRVAYWDDNIQSAKDDPCIVDAMTDWAIRQVKALPSAQLERKNGKWIGYDGDWLKTMCKCSECGAMIDINEKYRNFFCYHCGAKMER